MYTRESVIQDFTDEQQDLLKKATQKRLAAGQLKTVYLTKFTSKRRETWTIGDTVLLKSLFREPTIALITAIIKVIDKSTVIATNVSVHWFFRPSQLPQNRVKRAIQENEIYYSLSNSSIASIQEILSPCTVISSPSQQKSPHPTYLCLLATDVSRGLYYDFSFERHRMSALANPRFNQDPTIWDIAPFQDPSTPYGPSHPHTDRSPLLLNVDPGALAHGEEEQLPPRKGVTPTRPHKPRQAATTAKKRPRPSTLTSPTTDLDSQTTKRARRQSVYTVPLLLPTASLHNDPSSEGELEAWEDQTELERRVRRDTLRDLGAHLVGVDSAQGQEALESDIPATEDQRADDSPSRRLTMRTASDGEQLHFVTLPISPSKKRKRAAVVEVPDDESPLILPSLDHPPLTPAENIIAGAPRTPSRKIHTKPAKSTIKKSTAPIGRTPRSTRAKRREELEEEVDDSDGVGEDEDYAPEPQAEGPPESPTDEDTEGGPIHRPLTRAHGGELVEMTLESSDEEPLDVRPRSQSRSSRKSRAKKPPEDSVVLSYEEDTVLKTPSKRGGRTPHKATTAPTMIAPGTRTPRTKRTLAAPTPHSKAALRARASRKRMTVRPPLPAALDSHTALGLGAIDPFEVLGEEKSDPWVRAMHVLHVGHGGFSARGRDTDAEGGLVGREEEFGRVLRAVEELVGEGSGGCVYISGVPGTGKTATVHAVVRELKRMAEQNLTNPFSYVEINGLRIPDPTAAYGLLWEAVSGHDTEREGRMRISSGEALRCLTRHFAGGGARRGGGACVVLMDELDQLLTTKQDVVYNFFNWPTLVGSKLVVIAVANTMDLPERVMSGRVRSRLGMIRINFHPYTTRQLESIVHSRLQLARAGSSPKTSGQQEVLTTDGVKFAAMKVSSISGDARRVLDVCRRAVELVRPLHRPASTSDVQRVLSSLQNSPTSAFLRDLSFHERVLLASIIKCVRLSGVEEVLWGDVARQHLLQLGVLPNPLAISGAGVVRAYHPTVGELGGVLDGLLACRAVLCEEPGGAVRGRRGREEERRVMLGLERDEVERVLCEVGGEKWKNVMGI